MLKKVLVGVGVLVGLALLALGGAILYFRAKATNLLEQTYTIQVDPLPIPFPLSVEERDAFVTTSPTAAPNNTVAPNDTAAPNDPAAPAAQPEPGRLELHAPAFQAEATRRAIERAEKYLTSRVGCRDCHGVDFGGKVVVEAFPMGKWVAPNITRGGVTRNYQGEDWMRLVRHGVKPDGHPALMPCQDFTWLSDQEISDIALYISSRPPIERTMPPSEMGPVFAMLLATGQFPLAAATLDHEARRDKLPPALEPTRELGLHLARTCEGCHGPKLAGGPIVGGDPAWPEAANLTFHSSGLEGYSLHDFQTVLTSGRTKAGRQLNDKVMPIAYTKNLTAVEREALFIYLSSLPPLELGTR